MVESSKIPLVVWFLILAGLPAPPWETARGEQVRPGAGKLVVERRLGPNEFPAWTRDRFVELDKKRKGFSLAPTFLVSDTMARSAHFIEDLSRGVEAKKTFMLRSPCDGILVLFYVNRTQLGDDPMRIRVNGHEMVHHQDVEKMLTGGWDRLTVPAEYLVAGKNEIVFSGTGTLYVDPEAEGGNSFKRLSSQSPWKSDILGTGDNLTGEYVVRIRVGGHPERGTVHSNVIDMASWFETDEKKKGVVPQVDLTKLEVEPETESPSGTSVSFEVRMGTSGDLHPANWSEWFSLSELSKTRLQRFVQLRAALTSSRISRSPLLKSVRIRVEGTTSGANLPRIRVPHTPDNDVKVSSYSFRYSDPHHPRMRHLREKYSLETVAASGENDFQKMFRISQWVREQWEGWDMGKYDYCPQWDALEVLELAPAGLGLGMCTHYSATFVQAVCSLGYQARCVIVDHHCLAEAWSDSYGKWVCIDTGLVAKHPKAFMYADESGIPVNALELHERYLKGSAEDLRVVPEPPFSQEEWWKRYLNLYCRFAIPLRNDHLYNPEPQELEHGHDQYHWDGYLWWTDRLDPKYPEYSLQTNRPEDFYWTLNKTVIDVRDTEKAGILHVHLYGPIPNLKGFQIRVNGGKWKSTPAELDWNLETGQNTLEARAVNTMGLELPANRISVVYEPK